MADVSNPNILNNSGVFTKDATLGATPATDYTSGLSASELAVERQRESGKLQAKGTTVSVDTTPTPKAKKVANSFPNGDGTFTIIYDDGTSEVTGTKRVTPVLPTTAPVAASTSLSAAGADMTGRANMIAVMKSRFAQYGLGSLAAKIEQLAMDGATEATITLQLSETPEYQQRFSANSERLKKGLTVLSPVDYLNLEDGYRQVLRSYGLTQFDSDQYVKQFISNDVSATELSNRVVTAVQRVQNADPAITKTLRDYYGIGSTDLVAYMLDPEQNFQKIQRQVSAAEIGAAARLQGLEPGVATAEQLAAQGITQAQAQKGYSTIADILPTAEKLSAIYGNVDAYDQSTAEQDVFNSLASAQRKRQKLASQEISTFSGTSGTSKASLTSSKTAGQI